MDSVLTMYKNESGQYEDVSLFTALLTRHFNPERTKYHGLEQSAYLDLNPHLRDSYLWSDEELFEWIGRYHYMSGAAHDDGKQKVDEHFHVVNVELPQVDLQEHEEQENERRDAVVRLTARQSTVFLFTILGNANVDIRSISESNTTYTTLFSQITGYSEVTIEPFVKLWRNSEYPFRSGLSTMQKKSLLMDIKKVHRLLNGLFGGKDLEVIGLTIDQLEMDVDG